MCSEDVDADFSDRLKEAWVCLPLIWPSSSVEPMVHTPTVTHRCSGMTNGYLDTCPNINSLGAQQVHVSLSFFFV